MATPSQVVTGVNCSGVSKVSPDGTICYANGTTVTINANITASDGSIWRLFAGGTIQRNGAGATGGPGTPRALLWSAGFIWTTQDYVSWYFTTPGSTVFALSATPPLGLYAVNAQSGSQPPVGGCWNRGAQGPGGNLINSSPTFSGNDVGALLPSAALGGIAQGNA